MIGVFFMPSPQVYRVLLVEDEPGDALLIEKMLENTSAGTFEITWVSSLAEARVSLEKGSFHLILLDLSLPDSMGLETVREGYRSAGTVPVLVLTGHEDLEFALASLDEGAQDYLVKGSFDAEKLVRAIRYALTRAQGEQELRKSEERFRSVIQSMDDVLWIATLPEGECTFLSPSVEDLSGYSYEELKEDPRLWISRIHPEDLYQKTLVENRLRADRSMELIYRIIHKDGDLRWIRDRSQVIYNQKKRPKRMYGLLTDITKQMKAEEQIKEYTRELELKSKETERLYRQLDEKVDKAREIHEATIPDSLPQLEGISFSAFYKPAQKMGGDFYQVIEKDGKVILYLSDVTGHGLEGALLSLFVKNTIDSYLSLSPPDTIEPAKILRFLAEQYKKQNYPNAYFICIFLGVLDLESMELRYLGAGFQTFPLILYSTGEMDVLKSSGLFIGSLIPLDKLSLDEYSLTLEPGTTIFFTTDGLIEQEVSGRRFEERLQSLFAKTAHLPCEYSMCAIKEGFRIFNRGSLQGEDDITLLMMQVEPLHGKRYTLEVQRGRDRVEDVEERVLNLLPVFPERELLLGLLRELMGYAFDNGDVFSSLVVELSLGPSYLLATIEDESEGFDWNHVEIEERMREERGLSLTYHYCYTEKGSKAFLYVSYGSL